MQKVRYMSAFNPMTSFCPDHSTTRSRNCSRGPSRDKSAPWTDQKSEVLPDVPELDELDENTRALVLALNTLGTDGDDGGIVATLYKHATHWPGYLGLAWSQLAPLAATGDLQRAIRETEHIGRLAARSLAGDRHNVEAPDAVHAAATDAINRFVRYAISRMVPIGQILRQSLPA